MALTLVGATLTQRFQRSQTSLRAGFLRELLRLWPLLDPRRLDETAAAWLQLMVDLVLAFRVTAVRQAVEYYDAFRVAEVGEHIDVARFVGMDAVNANEIRTSLAVTGPIGIKHRVGQGVPTELASKKALVEVAGASSRHVLNGGRDLVPTMAAHDELAVGYARITGPKACYFCAMLASRGPVYLSERSALLATARSRRNGEPYHDNCQCAVEPSFDRDAPWPGRAREFEQLWKDSTVGTSGKGSINAFRRAFEGRAAKSS